MKACMVGSPGTKDKASESSFRYITCRLKMDVAQRPERVTLSRDLSEFLVELSIGVQKHAMYPGAHPSLWAATADVTRRAERLLADRPTLVFGVARRQLIIDGVATDPNQPVLRRLAEGLHRHHLGAVSLSRGLQPEEMGLALRALSSEVERDGPLGLAPAGRLLEWPHIRLHPLTFDCLEIVGAPTGSSDGKANARAAELWIGLARAAMTTDQPGVSPETISTEPTIVARAIDERHGAEAYDQVIVGYLLQIANELKNASAAEAAVLRRRTAQLIGALSPETLRRLVAMGGDAAQRREFVLNAASGMDVEAVIDILKAAADASGQTISHGLVRMLSKLAEHAELGHENVRPLADGALRDQVRQLLSGWQLDDPNPDAYGKVLQRLATTAPAKMSSEAVRRSDEQDPLRIVQMSLEVGEFGPLVDRAMDRIMDDGRFGPVLQLLASPPTKLGAAAEQLLTKMAAPTSIARLVVREPLDVDALDQLFPRIPLESYQVLLDALATSKNRSTRRRLLDRLAQTELDVSSIIAPRLDDEHWYVVRNMLVLLQRLKRLPPGFSAMRWADHPDVLVRYEAIQLGLALPTERDAALRRAFEDGDLRILRLGLTAVQHECRPHVVTLVAGVALNAKMIEELRVLAARALGRFRDPMARDALLQLVDGGRTLLGRPRLAAPTRTCVAAVRALSEGWPKDPAVAPILDLAVASSEPELRHAAAPGEVP